MAIYKLGSKGSEVSAIQEQLKSLGYYSGVIDGDFGGGTDVAVRQFQQSQGLTVDGVVGPMTWENIFSAPIPEPAIVSESLDYKCLALTGSFETEQGVPECFAGLSGDFDGQGMSLGALQWNFGQGTLHPLLNKIIQTQPDLVHSIFQDQTTALTTALTSSASALMAWVRSIQNPLKHTVNEPWHGYFKALGRTAAFQALQQQAAQSLYQEAQQLCSQYGLTSERAQALMFDLKVQNGSIPSQVNILILADFKILPAGLSGSALEIEKMKIIANRRAEACKNAWIEDVRSRKLCCALGQGRVHGIEYDLEAQYGIQLS
jgi:antitoxin component of RelBE/YafQ-DinJ toxin-antitoxin module